MYFALLFLFFEYDSDMSVVLKEDFPMKMYSLLLFICILFLVNLLVVFRGVRKIA